MLSSATPVLFYISRSANRSTHRLLKCQVLFAAVTGLAGRSSCLIPDQSAALCGLRESGESSVPFPGSVSCCHVSTGCESECVLAIVCTRAYACHDFLSSHLDVNLSRSPLKLPCVPTQVKRTCLRETVVLHSLWSKNRLCTFFAP